LVNGFGDIAVNVFQNGGYIFRILNIAMAHIDWRPNVWDCAKFRENQWNSCRDKAICFSFFLFVA